MAHVAYNKILMCGDQYLNSIRTIPFTLRDRYHPISNGRSLKYCKYCDPYKYKKVLSVEFLGIVNLRIKDKDCMSHPSIKTTDIHLFLFNSLGPRHSFTALFQYCVNGFCIVENISISFTAV